MRLFTSILGATMLFYPAAAAALDFDNNPNEVCLASEGGTNVYCTSGGAATALTSWTINLLGGDDILVVAGPDCDCDCSDANDDFIYGGNSLTVNGGDDGDIIFGADGRNLFSGNADVDDLRLGSHNSDAASGNDGGDTIIDDSGTSETLFGGNNNDTIRDLGCTFTTIDCGPGTDKCDCAGASAWCNNANCEFTAAAVSIGCSSI